MLIFGYLNYKDCSVFYKFYNFLLVKYVIEEFENFC